jgi:predicted dehydrogenase
MSVSRSHTIPPVPPGPMLNFAVIGPGRIADKQLAPALARVPTCRLWSVLSRDGERAQAFATRHEAASPRPAHTDLDSLLADPELHAVIIASPDKLHAQHAVAAARAGKHVLCEKPMATSPSEAAAIVEACAKADVRLGVAYHLRWHMGHRMLRARVLGTAGADLTTTSSGGGELGTIRHMRVQWTYRAPDASNWRAHEDVGRWWGLAGVGTHALDLVRWFMTPNGGEVVEVKSLITRAVWKGPHDETAIVALKFASGASAEIVTSVLFDAPTMVEIHGTRGSATCEGTLGPHGAGSIRVRAQAGEPQDLVFKPVNPFVGEIADFVSAIREKRPPEVDGEEGARNVEILSQAC